ncbi:hypothetical protein EUAN_08800 [Andreesenia angusta]|uniref:Uncharacterized protein n=1 Tax=Andreesenia angusta TaxID=39480 RepID=A0A1S1V921_9FIRM|nr:hypothetical protein [Andreesenia angusta]OHW63096.1 hypothetical protein EUAN_08800 [Andreesenia angusta]
MLRMTFRIATDHLGDGVVVKTIEDRDLLRGNGYYTSISIDGGEDFVVVESYRHYWDAETGHKEYVRRLEHRK